MDDEEDIQHALQHCHKVGDLPHLAGSLAEIPSILRSFTEIARDNPEVRVTRLDELLVRITGDLRADRAPPDAVRLVLERVIERWKEVLEPRISATGDAAAGYRLGRVLVERNYGQVYAVGDPNRVVKILRYPLDGKRRHEFYAGARLSRELADRYRDSFVAVHVLDPTRGHAVMDRYRGAKEYVELLPAERRPTIARLAATQLARALRLLHDENLAHGDLSARNVFVGGTDVEPRFLLGDLLAVEVRSSLATAAPAIPLPWKRAPAGAIPEHWSDMLSWTLFVHWVLTGTRQPRGHNPPTPATQAAVLARLRTLGTDPVANVLRHMLGATPCVNAKELEAKLAAELACDLSGPPRKPLVRRCRAEFDVFISFDSDDIAVARDLNEQLTERGLVPYLDLRDPVPEDWWPLIENVMKVCRSFAILVGKSYRAHQDAGQAREVIEASRMADAEDLPLLVFQLDGALPATFQVNRPTIDVARDVGKMADHIIRRFRPPSDDDGAEPARAARGSVPPPVGSEPPLPGLHPTPPPAPGSRRPRSPSRRRRPSGRRARPRG